MSPGGQNTPNILWRIGVTSYWHEKIKTPASVGVGGLDVDIESV